MYCDGLYSFIVIDLKNSCGYNPQMTQYTSSPKTCTIPGCNKKLLARGACGAHYARWRTTGQFNLKLCELKTCKKEGCSSKHYARGLCSKHFAEFRRASGYFAIAVRKPKTRFTDSARSSRSRNIEWSIPFELYESLIKLKCHYCGGPLPETKTGLDRKDNRIGYLVGNVVPCCWYCNHLKSDVFTYDEFVLFSKTELFQVILRRLHHRSNFPGQSLGVLAVSEASKND